MSEKTESNVAAMMDALRQCVSEAERAVVLKANAMLTLADHIDNTVYPQGGSKPVGRLTRAEWDLICYALRHTADSDN